MIVGILLAAMFWAVDPTPAAAPSVTMIVDAKHDGSDVDHAIIIEASEDSSGVDAEYKYIAGLSCGNGGSWKPVRQATVWAPHKLYDKLDVQCTDGGMTRSFYFDITSLFGKY